MIAPRLVIIGGGVTGLALATTLRREAVKRGQPLDLTVVERDRIIGGHARTANSGGFVVEAGPNGFLNREPDTLTLVTDLGLDSRLITANPAAARRFIVRGGRLHQVPDGPRTLVSTTALSWRAKARLLGEPWAAGPPAGVDETIHDFARRRIGAEAADVLVDTAVSGISAGDSRVLSVRSQFPVMVEMERDYGSLVKAMFRRPRSPLGPARLLSFDRGMGVLTTAMANALGDTLIAGRGVCCLERRDEAWSVGLDDGRRLEADEVVLATPASATARIVATQDASLTATLGEIPYAGIAVVALGYRTADVPRPLDGYGYLVTAGERLKSLGVVWESSLFSGRAPAGHALLRVMLGGSRTPSVLEGDDDRCAATAREELARVLGVRAEPVLTTVNRWPQAIARYTVGHAGRIERIRGLVARHPGLHVCGTSYEGVSFNQAVKSGCTTARGLAARLWTSDDARAAGRAAAVVA